MSSLSEMRKELKELRKASKEHAPVSRLRKGDVSSQLEALRHARETTAAPAAVPSAADKHHAAKHHSVKEMKAHEFPVAPAPKKAAPAASAKKGVSKAALRAMLDELSSDEE